ncbi:MFS transporter [soil metagenome]
MASFAQFAPAALMAPLGGSVADRFHRRNVLLVTQSAMAALALVLWALWTADLASPAAIAVVVALTGVVGGINIASWQAFVSELVPRSVLLNAVTLNSAQFNGARAFGPALGGVILATLGPGWAFAINAISYAGVLVALALVRMPRLVGARTGRAQVFAGFAATARYVRARTGMAACVLVVLALGLLGSPVFPLIKVFTDEVFGVGDTAFGLLSAALGIGSVLGAPIVAGWGSGLARSRLATGALLIYAGSLALFALAPAFPVAVLALVLAGAGYLAVSSTLNTTLQLQVDEAMRGKVLSLYVMGLTVSYPIGSLVQGWLADHIWARPTVAIAAGLLFAVTAWFRWGNGVLARLDDETTPPPPAPRPVVARSGQVIGPLEECASFAAVGQDRTPATGWRRPLGRLHPCRSQ